MNVCVDTRHGTGPFKPFYQCTWALKSRLTRAFLPENSRCAYASVGQQFVLRLLVRRLAEEEVRA